MIWNLWVYILISIGFHEAIGANLDNYEVKLREDLFVKRHVDTHTRPVTDHNETIDVALGLTITHIIELNEKTSTLSLNGWVTFTWTDKNFIWDKKDYGGINVLRVDPGLVWKPDIVPYNNAKAGNIDIYGETNVLIYPEGLLIWVPPASLHTICDVDVHDYPFDDHECEIKFGSWTHDGFLVNLTNYNDKGQSAAELGNEALKDLVTEHNEWKIVGVTQERKDKYYSCCKEPYPSVHFKIHLQRRAPYYQYTLVIPSLLTMIVTLIVFWLPPQAGEKVILSSLITLMQLILLVHMYYTVPRNGSKVPSIVIFNGWSMIFISLSIILSAISIKLSRTRYHSPVPVYLKNLLSHTIVKLLCLGNTYKSVIQDTGLLEISGTEGAKENSTGNNTKEFTDWLLVTTALNRVFFLVYILIYIVIICASFL